MATIEVKDLYKIFGPQDRVREALEMAQKGRDRDTIKDATGCVLAVNAAGFTVEEATIFVIMGLSGSGKSTLLRCVNRLIEPTSGEVHVDDQDIRSLDTEDLREWRKEKTAMVFQHFGLLAHRNVLGNAAFGLELQGIPREKREERARKSLELVGLADQADAMINELSGGMQQRVGLARALATEAGILLMDEAFSALDPLIRTRMQSELLELQNEMPKTILFITHDLGEALSLGDRVAIMKDGAVVQIGTPEEIILEPADDYVASFVENVDRSRVLTATAAGAEPPQLSATDSVSRALEVMEEGQMPYAFVMEDGEVAGAVRLRDAQRASEGGEPDLQDIVMAAGESVRPDDTLISILPKATGHLAPLPVVDSEGKLVGAVTKDMLLRAVAGEES